MIADTNLFTIVTSREHRRIGDFCQHVDEIQDEATHKGLNWWPFARG